MWEGKILDCSKQKVTIMGPSWRIEHWVQEGCGDTGPEAVAMTWARLTMSWTSGPVMVSMKWWIIVGFWIYFQGRLNRIK